MKRAREELDVLVDLVRRASHVETDAPSPGELRHLERAWRRRRRGPILFGALAVGGVVAAAAGIVLLGGTVAPPLGYAVEGDVAWTDGRVSVRAGRGAQLSFSDGTRFDLAGDTRAAIDAVDARGARVVLGGGRARVAVVHRPRARWAVAAGPFIVRVVGTKFEVAWSEADRVLEVTLTEGEVTVEGPLPQLPIAMRAGQRLVVRPGDLRIVTLGAPVAIAEPRPATPSAQPPPPPFDPPRAPDPRPPPSPPARAEPATAAPRVPTAAARVAPPAQLAMVDPATAAPAGVVLDRERAPMITTPIAPIAPAPIAPAPIAPAPVAPAPVAPAPIARAPIARQWAARLAAGEFQAIIDEALAEGLESSYQRRSSDELASLADAARYLGRSGVARAAFLAQRRRFAPSENAARAAFRLGVLAEEAGEASISEAIRWYDEYLGAAPAGTFAAEALGRKMLAVERRDGAAAARPLAESYPARFPRGAYLVHALRIVQSR